VRALSLYFGKRCRIRAIDKEIAMRKSLVVLFVCAAAQQVA